MLLAVITAWSCGAPDQAADPGAGVILRVDPRLDALVPADARIERIADGFVFTEGPVWIQEESRLMFSNVRANGIYSWTETEGVRST